MQAQIQIDLNNAEFDEENLGPGFARVLRDLAQPVEEQNREYIDSYRKNKGYFLLRDVNGNSIGRCYIKRG